MSMLSGISLRAVAASVPTQVARTADYEYLTVEDRGRFQKATGISERRISPANQYVSNLCAAAAERVMKHLSWDRESVGALILITQTADQPIPATSIVLQDKLALPQSCVTFDVNLGCSAYPYGLAIVGSLMRSLGISRGLMLMGDVSSRVCAIHDKSAWPLFGDAGSATALELNESADAIHLDLMSDGSGKDAIIVPGGGLASRIPAPQEGPVCSNVGNDGIARRPDNLILRGADIFSFAISKVPPSIFRVFESSARSVDEFDFLVLHQANKMINDTIARKTGFTPEKSLTTLLNFGNTSSASIPLTLCAHADLFSVDRTVLACGFGVGLSWASASITVPAGAVLPILETDDVD
jgi:3-oxoacyl-[acyl-carrier-protein] synthase-3